MQKLLLTTGLVLLQTLDLVAKFDLILYQLILIIAVFICIFVDNDAGLSDVDLQSESFVLRVTDQIFMEVHVLL